MDANEIASYLKSHPEFFEDYAELLLQIHVSNPHDGRAVSITERQMGVLRDKVKQLEAKLGELIAFGEENDLISAKVHRLGVALQGSTDLAGAMRVLYSYLGGDFAVPHVAVRLWGEAAGSEDDAVEFQPVPEGVKLLTGAMTQPYCGPAAGQEAVAWLGEAASHIRSVALIPLRGHGDTCFGVLLLASEELHRFYPEMGTIYLERIGDMTAAALLRTAG